MVVVVIGVLVVVWNFDLHRVITAKVRVRNAADAAAMAGARWQGITLNMIGDLNLIQVAILTEAYANDTNRKEFEVPGEASELHDLRTRLEFFGPLAAFAIAQQAAFNNGVLRNRALEQDLFFMAESIRVHPGDIPFPREYADLLEYLASQGAAVSAYSLRIPNHPLTDERFYAAIVQAMQGWWCAMYDYRYQLEHYESFEDWSKLDTEFRFGEILGLKLQDFIIPAGSDGIAGSTVPMPPSATASRDKYIEDLTDYLGNNEIVENYGDTNYVLAAIYPYNPDTQIKWSIYDSSWNRAWPKAADGGEEVDEKGRYFPMRSDVNDFYNYMGAETGIAVSAPVGRGILSSSDDATVDLAYKAKAKVFGTLEVDGSTERIDHLGFVFPCFRDVRLIPVGIGDRVLSTAFYRHVINHLPAYLDGGTEATNPDCRYCRLLKEWEMLDRAAGLEWLENAYEDDAENPCDPKGRGGGGTADGS